MGTQIESRTRKKNTEKDNTNPTPESVEKDFRETENGEDCQITLDNAKFTAIFCMSPKGPTFDFYCFQSEKSLHWTEKKNNASDN